MKLFSAMSARENNDLAKVKSQMSMKYLGGAARRTGNQPLRAMSSSRPQFNVVGVGVDEKYVDDAPTGVSVVKFLVRQKYPHASISKKDMLPKTIDGFETDVEEVGSIIPHAKKKAAAAAMPNPQGKFRPAQPGCSVGFREPSDAFIMAGTFGLVVKDTAGVHYVLSNNHVLAFESGVEADGVTKRVGLPVGSPIFQPGLLDGGNASTDEIAKLTRWIDLRADLPDNKVDGAIAQLHPSSVATADILFIGTPQGTDTATKDMICSCSSCR